MLNVPLLYSYNNIYEKNKNVSILLNWYKFNIIWKKAILKDNSGINQNSEKLNKRLKCHVIDLFFFVFKVLKEIFLIFLSKR